MSSYSQFSDYGDNYAEYGSRRGNATATAVFSWKSPAPYVLGGVGVMLILILFALIIIACSYLKKLHSLHIISSDFSTDHQCCGKDGFTPSADKEADEQTVLAIMAGHEKPSFLAKAMPFHREDQMASMV